MKVICVVCPAGTEIEEAEYPKHMEEVHKGKTQLQAIQQEKEIAQNIPIEVPLDKTAPPTAEFLEMAKALDTPKKEEKKEEPKAEKPKEEKPEPLKLKYVWQGNCPQCNTPVRTVVTKFEGKWFATAYCLTHEELEQKEVNPI